LLVAGLVGSAVNDSGLAVAGAVMAIAWPAFFLVAPGPEPSRSTPGDRGSPALAAQP
jgi:hypothetical protein